METLQHNLKALRKAKGWSQRQVAGMINMTQQSVAGHERGTRMPPVETCLLYCRVYGIGLDELVGGSHEKAERGL